MLFCFVFSMLLYPWSKGGWGYVQEVWHHWQSLNVGVLALLSSVIAFNISSYNTEKQRERNFVASKAFLPDALSELIDYFSKCSLLLKDYYNCIDNPSLELTGTQEITVPVLSDEYKNIFSNCISNADREVADKLASILRRLQIHRARFSGLFEGSTFSYTKDSIISKIYCLADLHADVSNLFNFARSLNDFDGSEISQENIINSYHCLNITIEEYEGLWELTVRNLK